MIRCATLKPLDTIVGTFGCWAESESLAWQCVFGNNFSPSRENNALNVHGEMIQIIACIDG